MHLKNNKLLLMETFINKMLVIFLLAVYFMLSIGVDGTVFSKNPKTVGLLTM